MTRQVRPILRLAWAMDNFGKGRDLGDFRLAGPTEIRRAGAAFNLMRKRMLRHIGQRTELLAAVSHDLRTPLTRMKLELEMLAQRPAAARRSRRPAHRRRGDGQRRRRLSGFRPRRRPGRRSSPTDLGPLLQEIAAARRHRADPGRGRAREPDHPAAQADRDPPLPVQPGPQRGALRQLGRPPRRRPRTTTSGSPIDDDGPGIPRGPARSGVQALLPARCLAQPEHRRRRARPHHRPRHRPRPWRRHRAHRRARRRPSGAASACPASLRTAGADTLPAGPARADAPPVVLASASAIRAQLLAAAGVTVEQRPATVDEQAIQEALQAEGASARGRRDRSRRAQGAAGRPPHAGGRDRARRRSDPVLRGPLVRQARGPRRGARPARRARRPRGTSSRPRSSRFAAARASGTSRRVAAVAAPLLAGVPRRLPRRGRRAALTSVGAYQIEDLGAQLLARIEGDHFAVLGLPVLEVLEFLRAQGVLVR